MIAASKPVSVLAAAAFDKCLARGGSVRKLGIIGLGDGGHDRNPNYLRNRAAYFAKIAKIAKELPPIDKDYLSRSDIKARYKLNKSGMRNVNNYDLLPNPTLVKGVICWSADTVKEMEKRLIESH